MSMWLTLSIKQNSQNIANNSSNVTVTATASWNAPHWNASGLCTGTITIDGTIYDFSGITFNTSQTSSGSKELMTQTVDVPHNENGSKVLYCSASFNTRLNSCGTISTSDSKTLTTIARKAYLIETPSLTLGTEGTLKITRASQDILRHVTYSCGTFASGTIFNEADGSASKGTSIPWTFDLALAAADPTSDYANITLTITSYYDDHGYLSNLGTNTYTIKAKVPDTVGPEITSVTVTEGYSDEQRISEVLYHEYDNKYEFVQAVSILKVKITATGDSYGSTIKKCSTTIGGVTYSGSEFTVTDTSKLSGDVTITTTVTDNRGSSGRTATNTQTVKFAPYANPKITKFIANRANSDGSKNTNGNYILVEVSGTYDKTVGWAYRTLQYRANDTSAWNTVDATTLTFSASDGTFSGSALIGEVDESRYAFQFIFYDNLNYITNTIEAPTTAPIMHFNASGNGVGFGKVAELHNVFDVAFQTKFTGGILYPTLEAETDLDTVLTPNTYSGLNQTSANYLNCPLTSGSFMFEVKSAGADGQLLQRLTRCHKTQPTVYERFYYNDDWGEWIDRGWTDPNWTQITALEDEFAAYGDNTDNLPRYRRDGRVVEINGQLTLTKTTTYSASSLTMFTLPEGYRPTSGIFTLCQGSGTGVWFLTVNSNGTVTFARYRYGNSESSTAGVNTWLPFHITFLV